jgi:branched-chain amino acid transport system substrate-binding protein
VILRRRHGSALLTTLLLACSSGNEPIRIGLAGPFSDAVGAPMKRAAELAVAEINAAGGIRGRPVQLLARDDFGDPDSAVGVAADLVEAGVVAVIGHVYSGTTLATAPVYNQAGVTQISPSSTSPRVSAAGDYTFRVCPSDLQQGAALAQFAAERLGFRRGTILYLNDDYGRGLRATFASEFARLGGKLDEVVPYLGDTPDLSVFLERVARRGTSEFIFIGGNRGEAEQALATARARGIRIPMLGGDGLEGIEQAGSLAEGTYVSNGYLASLDSPRNNEFVAAWRHRYPDGSEPNQPAAATYDILFLLRDVIGRVGTDQTSIRDAVAEIGRRAPAFQGVTGDIAFDGKGDVPKQRVVIGVVAQGRIVAVEGM